ncbi:hypothetical protein AYI69_g8451 [Smittium culicis]|uniref:Uncharacterized protein n=1 Tax=Smittium culicis TaxID=133412 RepID=A0A1R1XJI0_9FUNG|nr:hypothetical protein AYI69_g8451 [Smittium culicis]
MTLASVNTSFSGFAGRYEYPSSMSLLKIKCLLILHFFMDSPMANKSSKYATSRIPCSRSYDRAGRSTLMKVCR